MHGREPARLLSLYTDFDMTTLALARKPAWVWFCWLSQQQAKKQQVRFCSLCVHAEDWLATASCEREFPSWNIYSGERQKAVCLMGKREKRRPVKGRFYAWLSLSDAWSGPVTALEVYT